MTEPKRPSKPVVGIWAYPGYPRGKSVYPQPRHWGIKPRVFIADHYVIRLIVRTKRCPFITVVYLA